MQNMLGVCAILPYTFHIPLCKARLARTTLTESLSGRRKGKTRIRVGEEIITQLCQTSK